MTFQYTAIQMHFSCENVFLILREAAGEEKGQDRIRYTGFFSPLPPPAGLCWNLLVRPGSDSWWCPRSSRHPADLRPPPAACWDWPAPEQTHTHQLSRSAACVCVCMMSSGLSLYLLYVDLDVLLQAVAIQVEHEIVDEIEAVAHDDERKLIGEFGFLCNDTTKTWLQIQIKSDELYWHHKQRYILLSKRIRMHLYIQSSRVWDNEQFIKLLYY